MTCDHHDMGWWDNVCYSIMNLKLCYTKRKTVYSFYKLKGYVSIWQTLWLLLIYFICERTMSSLFWHLTGNLISHWVQLETVFLSGMCHMQWLIGHDTFGLQQFIDIFCCVGLLHLLWHLWREKKKNQTSLRGRPQETRLGYHAEKMCV